MEKNKEEQETEEAGGHPLCKTPEETDEESGLKEDIKEESDLEEDLEEAEEEIEEDKFVEFITPSNKSSSTSLRQVAVASELRATDLEQDLSNVIGLENNKKEGDDPFKYKIGADPEQGPKYINSGNEIERTVAPSNVDIMSLGRKPDLMPHEVGFSASPSTKIGEVEGPGKYELPDKFDVDKLGKGKLFERPDVKYKPST